MVNGNGDDEVVNITIFSTATSSFKWWFSILLGVLFFILSLPASYRISSNLSSIIEGDSLPPSIENDCYKRVIFYSPSPQQALAHATIFTLLVRLLMW